MFEGIFRVKVIGRGVGAGRPGDPRDGDGDGFYSPKPGMPDKTPIPVGLVQHAPQLRLPPPATFAPPVRKRNRDVEAVVTRLKTIENDVVAEHGPLKTHRDARRALTKAFPNAQIDAFFHGSNPNEPLRANHRSIIIGLLHGAKQYPESAKWLDELSADGRFRVTPDDRYAGAVGFGWNPRERRFTQRMDFLDALLELPKIRDDALLSPNAGWTTAVGLDMQEAGHSPAEINHLLAMGTAIHEMGHLHHNARIADHIGITQDGRFIPGAVLRDGLGVTDREVAVMVRDEALKLVESNPELTPQQIQMLAAFRLITLNARKIMDGITSRHDADDLSEAERRAAAGQMGKVSNYAQQMLNEGYAEWRTAQELGDGKSMVTVTPEVSKFFEWLNQEKAAKPEKVGNSEYSDYVISCRDMYNPWNPAKPKK